MGSNLRQVYYGWLDELLKDLRAVAIFRDVALGAC